MADEDLESLRQAAIQSMMAKSSAPSNPEPQKITTRLPMANVPKHNFAPRGPRSHHPSFGGNFHPQFNNYHFHQNNGYNSHNFNPAMNSNMSGHYPQPYLQPRPPNFRFQQRPNFYPQPHIPGNAYYHNNSHGQSQNFNQNRSHDDRVHKSNSSNYQSNSSEPLKTSFDSKQSGDTNESERRLPARFNRIEKSDSESEEDDRLDDYAEDEDRDDGDKERVDDSSSQHSVSQDSVTIGHDFILSENLADDDELNEDAKSPPVIDVQPERRSSERSSSLCHSRSRSRSRSPPEVERPPPEKSPSPSPPSKAPVCRRVVVVAADSPKKTLTPPPLNPQLWPKNKRKSDGEEEPVPVRKIKLSTKLDETAAQRRRIKFGSNDDNDRHQEPETRTRRNEIPERRRISPPRRPRMSPGHRDSPNRRGPSPSRGQSPVRRPSRHVEVLLEEVRQRRRIQMREEDEEEESDEDEERPKKLKSCVVLKK